MDGDLARVAGLADGTSVDVRATAAVVVEVAEGCRGAAPFSGRRMALGRAVPLSPAPCGGPMWQTPALVGEPLPFLLPVAAATV